MNLNLNKLSKKIKREEIKLFKENKPINFVCYSDDEVIINELDS